MYNVSLSYVAFFYLRLRNARRSTERTSCLPCPPWALTTMSSRSRWVVLYRVPYLLCLLTEKWRFRENPSSFVDLYPALEHFGWSDSDPGLPLRYWIRLFYIKNVQFRKSYNQITDISRGKFLFIAPLHGYLKTFCRGGKENILNHTNFWVRPRILCVE